MNAAISIAWEQIGLWVTLTPIALVAWVAIVRRGGET